MIMMQLYNPSKTKAIKLPRCYIKRILPHSYFSNTFILDVLGFRLVVQYPNQNVAHIVVSLKV